MHKYCIIFASLFAVAYSVNMCQFTPPKKDVDWDRIMSKNWRWGMYTLDQLGDFLQCSDVELEGVKGKSVEMTMKFGPNAHQVFNLNAVYSRPGEYDLQDRFTTSWKNIVRHNNPKYIANRIIAEEIYSEKKNHVVFYTDHRNYLISALCLPNGRMSVVVFTPHVKVSDWLETRIQNVLQKHNIDVATVKTNCKGRPSKVPRQ